MHECQAQIIVDLYRDDIPQEMMISLETMTKSSARDQLNSTLTMLIRSMSLDCVFIRISAALW